MVTVELVVWSYASTINSGISFSEFSPPISRYNLNLLILDTNDATRQHGSISFSFIDSPSSTSEVTYKTQFNNEQGSGTVNIQKNANSTMVLMEIAG